VNTEARASRRHVACLSPNAVAQCCQRPHPVQCPDELGPRAFAAWRSRLRHPDAVTWNEYGGTIWGGPGSGTLSYRIRNEDLRAQNRDCYLKKE
jgi:hypothetical protein